VLCRGEDRQKEPRWEALEDGAAGSWPGAQLSGDWQPRPVSVLMWLGDNIGDFPHQEQDIRHLEEPLSGFGTRFIVLPNPMYGSWEENPRD